MACLRMALAARDGHAPSLFTLLDGCLEYGGYAEEPRGRVTGLRLLATSYETCGVTFE